MDVRLIRAFIASPGGLDEERRIAWAAAEEVNRAVARGLGFRLELIGWEETISGVGRPQSLINAELETCDLFIGAMWTQWGSRPSVDGPYTSGFEEEFELSFERNEATGTPNMAMFFKDIPAPQLADPGDELRKVLAFQQQLIDGKKLLFRRFATPEEFGKEVRELLATYVIERHNGATAAVEEDRPRPTTQDRGNSTKIASSENPKEAAFLADIERKMQQRNIELEPVEVARLRLVSASLGRPGNDDPDIGVHDINLIYRHRQELDLSVEEKLELLGGGLRRISDENVPIWTWVADSKATMSEALTISSLIGLDDTRVGAIAAMTLIGARMLEEGKLSHQEVVARWFASEEAAPIRLAALRYLKEYGSLSDLPIVNAEIERGGPTDTLALAIETAAEIHWRVDEEDALRFLLSSSFETLDRMLFDRALSRFEALTSEDLIVGLDHRSPEIRARSVELLSVRGELSPQMTRRAMEDTSPSVRAAAAHALDRDGTPLLIAVARETIIGASKLKFGFFGLRNVGIPHIEPAFENYRKQHFAKMPLGQLETLASTNDPDREAAYLSLCERRFSSMGNELRREIDDGFQKYVAMRWPDGIPSRAFGGAAGLLTIDRSAPEERKRRELVSEATSIVARRRELIDIDRIRVACDLRGVQMTPQIIAYFAALGSWQDIMRIAKAPPSVGLLGINGTSRRPFSNASRAILKLATGRIADVLVLDIQPLLLAEILREIPASLFSQIERGRLLDLLHHADSKVRRVAAMRTSAVLSRTKAASIMRDYMEGDRAQYYNVIHWLDLRLALEPDAVRNAVAQSLSS